MLLRSSQNTEMVLLGDPAKEVGMGRVKPDSIFYQTILWSNVRTKNV